MRCTSYLSAHQHDVVLINTQISGQRKTHLKCAIFGSTATPFFEYNCENSSNMELNFPRLFSDVVFVSLENLGELIVDGNPTIEGVQARNNLIEAFARQKNNTTNKTNRLLVLWTATNSPQLIDDELSSLYVCCHYCLFMCN